MVGSSRRGHLASAPFQIVLLACACARAWASFAPRPVIAVFTQTPPHPGPETLAASYVKWVEAAGARVIPIRRRDSDARVREIMHFADGLLFPGGSGLPPRAAHVAWKIARERHAAGVPTPVWGTCLGFEWLMQIVSADNGVLASGLDSWNLTLPLSLTPAASTSRILGGTRAAPVRAALAALPITMNNHYYGIAPHALSARGQLRSFFNVLSTSRDRRGVEFVSTVEARPEAASGALVGGTQWHPEKAVFEWGFNASSGAPVECIDHSADAVLASQHLANVLVGEARRSALARGSSVGCGGTADDCLSELIWQYPVDMHAAPFFVQSYAVLPRLPPQ